MKFEPKLERLPYSKETETAFLGAILVDTVGVPEQLDQLEWTDFFLQWHQTIFRHIKGLRALGKPTNDLAVLTESLEAMHELEAAGGVGYVASLIDGMPRVTNLPHYIEIIKTKAQARRAIHQFKTNIDRILSANGNLLDVLQDIATHSAPVYVKYGQHQPDPFKRAVDLAEESNTPRFVVKPYLAAGAVTELVAKIKTGKTTYALGELVRKALAKGPVVYLTEQPTASFRVALERAGILNADNLFVLFFNAVIGLEWIEIANKAIEKCKQAGAVLLVVDTLSHFVGLEGDTENDSGAAIACMKPLQEAASNGIAVLTVRHERKSGGEVGDAGRGSSAFAGAADTLLTLRRTEGRTRSTLRKIECISRFDDLPPEAIYEYANGQYQYMGTANEISEHEAELLILANAPDCEENAKDLSELLEGSEIARTTAQRVIKKLVGQKLTQTGKGRRGSPFRYFLSEKVSAQTPHIEGSSDSKPTVDTAETTEHQDGLPLTNAPIVENSGSRSVGRPMVEVEI